MAKLNRHQALQESPDTETQMSQQNWPESFQVSQDENRAGAKQRSKICKALQQDQENRPPIH